MKKIILLMFLLNLSVTYGQRTENHKVDFSNVDGFDGYVTFTTSYEGFATQLKGYDAKLYIKKYHKATSEELNALKKAGIDLTSYAYPYQVPKFSVDVEGYGLLHYHSSIRTYRTADNKSTFRLSNSLGDYVTPDFSQYYKDMINEWQRENPGKSVWEEAGGFKAQKVTALYLSDLKNEIDKILAEYNKGKRAFEAHISRGTSSANNFDFESAADALSEAKEASNKSNDHNSKIKALEQLIAVKKKEAEQKEKEAKELAEKEEAERKEKEAKESGSETSDSATLKVKSASGKDSSKEEDSKDSSEAKSSSSSSELTSTQKAAVKEGVGAQLAERAGNYTEALNKYRSAKAMGNTLISDAKIQQMEIMSGVQQIGGLITYWAENARKQKEMRAAAERRRKEIEVEAEAQFEQRMMEQNELHLPITDYTIFSALKEATDKDLVPFIGSEFEQDAHLYAEFEKVRESLSYFYMTNNAEFKETNLSSGGSVLKLQGKNGSVHQGYVLKFDENQQRKGKGKFTLMSNETHSMIIKYPPYSADIIPGIRIRNGFYNTDKIQGYVRLGQDISKSEVRNLLSKPRTDLVDFGLKTFLGEYTIAINAESKKFHLLFEDFKVMNARYEFTWYAHDFNVQHKLNYLFSATVTKRKINIQHNFGERQSGFFIDQDTPNPITQEIALHYLPITGLMKDPYDGKYHSSYEIDTTTLEKTTIKSAGYNYFDINESISEGFEFHPAPWFFYKKNKNR